MLSFSLTIVALLPLAAIAQQSGYAQCGGSGWTGATDCVSGYACSSLGEYYYQCLPGQAATTTSLVSTTGTAPATTSATTTITATTTTSDVASTTLSGGSGPGATLQSGYYWIRAVESPNFHKYLQTNPEYTTGIAIMDNYTTAGQFNIVDGQLVELIDSGLLYANVEVQTGNATTLAVTFETTENDYGTFSFSGDAVEWSVATIDRPNDAAWYVCTDQQLFINLGAYDYGTPPDCADETIHYYNGATAVD